MNRARRFARALIAAWTESPAFTWNLAFGLLTALACTSVLAQSLTPPAGGSYVMRKQAIAGGGARATGGTLILTGTVAQALTLPTPSTGGNYALRGGFHVPETSSPQVEIIFENGFEN